MVIHRDILDIIEIFDVTSWNKGIQIKGNAPDIIKRSQERGEGMEGIAQGNRTPASNSVLRQKGSEDYIIDPANKEDVANLVGCEKS